MKNKIKVGIIGIGNVVGIAAAYLEGYRMSEQAELTAKYNKDSDLAKSWCEHNEFKEFRLSPNSCYQASQKIN